MFFIGVITNRNSENNLKSIMKEREIEGSKIIFLNDSNVSNFKNVKFDSVVLNEAVKNEGAFEKILENSKYILLNSDIHYRSNNLKDEKSKIITYGYNSKATVTISSVTDECYMIFIQDNIYKKDNIEDIQEIKFEKLRENINVYDSMIITIMNLLYNK